MTSARKPLRVIVMALTALVATALAAGPAIAAPTNAKGVKWKAEAEVTTLESTERDGSLVVLEPTVLDASTVTQAAVTGSLFDVATRIRLIDPSGASLVPYTGKGVTIAMIDTGVVPVDGLAKSKVVVGPDFSFEDQHPELRGLDTNGHGTHMAGIMVAADEAWAAGDTQRRPERVLGIAPDATLLSIKAGTADGSVDVTQIIAAVNWAIRQKETRTIDIDVLNLSYSVDSALGYAFDPLMYAVERAWAAGIVVVAASGNEGSDWKIQSPARDPFIIAVGASELESERETSTEFTSISTSRPLDVQAPGRSIISLRATGAWFDQYNEQGRVGESLVRGSGTSQAAAVVSGAVALLLEARPELTPDEVKAIIRESAWQPATSMQGWEKWTAVNERYLDLATGISLTVPATTSQTHKASTGTGPIDGARGWEPLVQIDGIGLTGPQDIFGSDWAGSRWTVDSWIDNAWSGGSWAGGTWAGGSWAGGSWATDMWTGGSWTGGSWAGGSWAGGSWAGGSWAGGSWAGGSWAGGSWAGGSWAGGSWSGGSWAGDGWN